MPYPYATLAAVKLRLFGDATTVTTDDPILAAMCEQTNARLELYTRRAIGSSTVTQTVNGYSNIDMQPLENGHLLLFKDGIRNVGSLQLAAYTGGSFSTVPATDYFILPASNERQPGWPGFELWMSNVPSASNSLPYVQVGFSNVLITYDAGWDAMPADVREVAETATVRAYQRRQVGESDQTGAPDLGVSIVFNKWEQSVLDVYRWRPVFVV